jgi:non-canonical purine NTP pyrophosphatase (RdgB/HAM1 family)
MSSYSFYISSENEGKVREIKQFIKEECKIATEIIPLTINHLTDKQKSEYNPVENGESFLENARIKARALFSIVNAPVIADDSGLEVDILNGEPGVFSSRYEKTDELRIGRLLKELENYSAHLKTARFVSCICFIDKTGNEIFFNGKVEGLIIDEPRGKNGFGYDPVFLYPPMNKTFGELLAEEKQTISHRSKALKLFLHFLDRYIA